MRLSTARLEALALLLLVGTGVAHVMPSATAGERLSPKEQAQIELGRRLFFDPLASRSGARSCASCHDPEHGFSDPAPRSKDDMGLTRRHSQTLIDGRLNPNAHWDGEFQTMEVLVSARLTPVSSGKGMLSHGAAPEGSGSSSDSGSANRMPGPGAGPEPGQGGGGGNTGEPGNGNGGGGAGGGGESGGGYPATREPGAPEEEGGEAATPPPAASDAPPAAAPPEGQAAEPKPAEPKAADPKAPVAPKASTPPENEHDPEVPLDIRKLPRVDVSIEHASRYREAFVAAYGSPAVNVARIADAIAAYCLTIESSRSRYDRFAAGEQDVLSLEEQRGFELFRGRARCAECHVTTPGADGRAPLTDYAFHNTGVALSEFAREQAIQTLRGVAVEPDKGRERVSTRTHDRRAFKTPSLRDVAERGPWFHDGSAKTLEEAVHYYAKGGAPDPDKSDLIGPLTLTEPEVRSLVAFLKALSGETRAGLAPVAWSKRAETTRLTFVDGLGRRMPGFTITLTAAGDVLPGWKATDDAPVTLVTDERGQVAFAPPLRTHVRLGLPEGLTPVEGELVPDTCTSARIEVPVAGRLRVLVEAPATTELPTTLAAEHIGVMVLPGHPVPRTLLTSLGVMDGPEGQRIAAYAGWRRTDVPSNARLLLPGTKGSPQRVKVSLTGPVTTVKLP